MLRAADSRAYCCTRDIIADLSGPHISPWLGTAFIIFSSLCFIVWDSYLTWFLVLSWLRCGLMWAEITRWCGIHGFSEFWCWRYWVRFLGEGLVFFFGKVFWLLGCVCQRRVANVMHVWFVLRRLLVETLCGCSRLLLVIMMENYI